MKMNTVLAVFVCGIVVAHSVHLPQNFPILPGTKWCGNGNIASSTEDVGLIQKTDKCCRGHDMCPDSIPAGQNKHGLQNNHIFTRSHCDCDTEFYNCLKQAGNPLSLATGTTYFTILGPKCFQKAHLIKECRTKYLGRCVEYTFNDTEEPVYQWFDNPVF